MVHFLFFVPRLVNEQLGHSSAAAKRRITSFKSFVRLGSISWGRKYSLRGTLGDSASDYRMPVIIERGQDEPQPSTIGVENIAANNTNVLSRFLEGQCRTNSRSVLHSLRMCGNAVLWIYYSFAHGY